MEKTKEMLLIELSSLLITKPIKESIAEIGAIRDQLYELTTDEEELNITNTIKDKIQKEAHIAWQSAGRRGVICIATGVGKTKIAVHEITTWFDASPSFYPLVVVPTEYLRDTGWKEEFDKWGSQEDWHRTDKVCYLSLNKIEGKRYDLIVLDEGHNITDSSAEFFKLNRVMDIMVLTATPPDRWSEKATIFRQLGIKPVYELSLDEAVTLGIATPYNITIVTMPLDDTHKYIKAGNKAKPFFQTERQRYTWLTRSTFSGANGMARINRMQFIYALQSKIEGSKSLLKFIPNDLKTLIFCSNKKQAIALSNKHYFSRPTITPKARLRADKVAEYELMMEHWHKDEDLNEFIAAEEGGKLSCCEALNEGVNLGKIDVAFIAQLNSQKRHFIQRIGRILRYYRGHVGEIIILAVENTVDMEWVNKAVRGLNLSKIRYVTLEEILTGKPLIINNNQKQEETYA